MRADPAVGGLPGSDFGVEVTADYLQESSSRSENAVEGRVEPSNLTLGVDLRGAIAVEDGYTAFGGAGRDEGQKCQSVREKLDLCDPRSVLFPDEISHTAYSTSSRANDKCVTLELQMLLFGSSCFLEANYVVVDALNCGQEMDEIRVESQRSDVVGTDVKVA